MQYIFSHPKTGETIEVSQKANDKHEYTDSKGIKWNRVFTVPHAAIDTKIDPFSSKEYIGKGGRARTTYGELLDRSQELSEKRKQIAGHDPIQEAFIAKERKRRGGKKFGVESTLPDVIEV